jgi:hypothetical protein
VSLTCCAFDLYLTYFYRIDEMVSSSTHTVKVMNLADNDFQTFATNLAHYHPVEELDM